MAHQTSPAVEIISAIAMPVAIIVVALSVLAIVVIFAFKRSALRLKVRDWVEIDGHSPQSSPSTAIVPVASQRTASAFVRNEETNATDDSSETVEPGSVESKEGSASNAFLEAKTAPELEAAFKELTNDPTSYVCESREFWETWYTKRFHDLSKSQAAPALQKLSDAQSGWSWPSVYLMRLYGSSGRLEEAETQLKVGLSRPDSDGFINVLTEGAGLYYHHVSPERAWEFVKEQIAAGIPDPATASLIAAVTDLQQASEPHFGNLILREIELGLDTSRYGNLWKLAYAYGEQPYSEILGYRRYRELVLADESVSGSLNNMGVIASHYDDQLGILHQEEALERSELFAIGNIANRLIGAGFLDRAKALLDATEDKETPTISRARTALHDALEARGKKLQKLRDIATTEGNRVRTLALKAYRQWLNSTVFPLGRYQAIDGSAELVLTAATAQCTITAADRKFGGTLLKLPLGYDGSVESTKPGETILTAKSRRVLALPTSAEEITLVVFNADARFEPLGVVPVRFAPLPEPADSEVSG